MKFDNKRDFQNYKNLKAKKAVFILGYTLGIKACLKSLTNVEKSAMQDLTLFKVLREQELEESEGVKNE